MTPRSTSTTPFSITAPSWANSRNNRFRRSAFCGISCPNSNSKSRGWPTRRFIRISFTRGDKESVAQLVDDLVQAAAGLGQDLLALLRPHGSGRPHIFHLLPLKLYAGDCVGAPLK